MPYSELTSSMISGPSEVSAIELSYDNTDTVEEFTVTFQVQYFTIGETDDTVDGDETQGTDAG